MYKENKEVEDAVTRLTLQRAKEVFFLGPLVASVRVFAERLKFFAAAPCRTLPKETSIRQRACNC